MPRRARTPPPSRRRPHRRQPAKKRPPPHRTPPPTYPPCRHCGRRRYIKNKGLCKPCFYTPAINHRYGPVDPRGSRHADSNAQRKSLPLPTDAEPGSEEKLAILEERARLGQELFHPEDRRHEHAPGACGYVPGRLSSARVGRTGKIHDPAAWGENNVRILEDGR